MSFKSGKIPMRYLGVPLLAKKLGVNDFKFLVDKVASRVNSWRNKVLSYVGRIQLIDLVLSSMQVYGASVYMFPLIVIKEIDMLLQSAGTNDSSGCKSLLEMSDKIKRHVEYEVGNGKTISVWYDKWSFVRTLDSFIPRTTVYDAWFKDDAKLAHLIEDAQWIWPKEWSDKFHVLTNVKPPNLVNNKEDSVILGYK
ncbi:hypothetical protein Tco_0674617 [Tanacetum coccineum]